MKFWAWFSSYRVSGSDFKTFKSRSRIFKQGSRRLGESRILPFATPNVIAKLDESCKGNSRTSWYRKTKHHSFPKKIITLNDAKTQEIITKVEKQERESLERLKIQTSDI